MCVWGGVARAGAGAEQLAGCQLGARRFAPAHGPRAAERRAGGGGRYLQEVRVPLELPPCEVRKGGASKQGEGIRPKG